MAGVGEQSQALGLEPCGNFKRYEEERGNRRPLENLSGSPLMGVRMHLQPFYSNLPAVADAASLWSRFCNPLMLLNRAR